MKLKNWFGILIHTDVLVLFFVAWPSNCEECVFNNSTKRAECTKCADGLGVTYDKTKCAGK